jgi:cell wall-associated NlpC family hydrolase
VRSVWHRAGGTLLPTSRDALSAAGRPVDARELRIGDLVVYAAPFDHVGIYVGDGQMVDASRALGKVVLRPVWASPGRTLLRLPA